MNVSQNLRSSLLHAGFAALAAAVALACGTLGISPASTMAMANDEPLLSISPEPGPSRMVRPASGLPFSLQDFASFLSESFQVQPTENEPDRVKFIFTERQNDGRDVEIMRVVIQERQAHLQVAFSFKEFNVMHYVAEFIEAPFFLRAESEQLYALLYASGGQRSWKQAGRFQARCTLIDGGEGIDALFEFAASTRGAGQR